MSRRFTSFATRGARQFYELTSGGGRRHRADDLDSLLQPGVPQAKTEGQPRIGGRSAPGHQTVITQASAI